VLQLPLVGPPLARIAIARTRRSPERRRAAFLGAVAHPDEVMRDPALAALLQEAADRLVDADLRVISDWAARAMALDVRPLAPRLRQPTLVVSGMLDRITRPAGATRLVSMLPAGRLLRLPRAAHFPHLEDPQGLATALLDFIESTEPAHYDEAGWREILGDRSGAPPRPRAAA
jgi:pimeloyl-ACP methyl ester carboxylesterase